MVRNDFKIMEHFRRRKRSFQTLGLAMTWSQCHVLAQAQPGWGSGPMELVLSLLLLSGFICFSLDSTSDTVFHDTSCLSL